VPEAGASNVELAHHISETKTQSQPPGNEILETLEAIVLAIVAVATAWSGYQAALWTGHEEERYAESSKLRVQAEGIQNTATQELLYNAATIVEWLKAEAQADKRLADLFERRILPEFRPAFAEWKKTDPVHNPNAPAGPEVMAGFRSSKADEAAKLNQKASEIFQEGSEGRQRSDDYVRLTVTLATILLLTSISQRFRIHRVRVAMVVVSALLLCVPLYRILTLPRA
jgi:hypothetical protein